MYRSISTVKADLAQTECGATGSGIVWAVLFAGVDASHRHFQRFRNLELPPHVEHLDYSSMSRSAFHAAEDQDENESMNLLLNKRFTVSTPVDVRGWGTAVAGIIAGRSPFGDQLMKGVAPETKIVSFDILGKELSETEVRLIAALRAIQYINQREGKLLIHGVVAPISLPWDARNYACGHSPVCAEVNRTVNSGVVVVTMAGNIGFDTARQAVVEGGITDPGNAELGITVGATHRVAPQIYGPSYFSCRGPTADGRRKPDILAPGERVETCGGTYEAPPPEKGKRMRGRRGRPSDPGPDLREEYMRRDGTSIAAAHVAGAAAALLSVRRDLIGNPREVKDILLRAATDLGREPMYQGAGLLDVLAALREATGKTKPAVPSAKPLKVFCSYAHRDKALWEEFRAHLSPLERGGRIQVWSDGLIEPGKRWEEEIYRELNIADIVLLLVSAYFVESEFCYSKELKRAIEREAEGSVTIVPVRVRPVSLKGTPLSEIQTLPSEAKPITSFGDPHQGWTEVAERLYDLVEKLRADGKGR